MVFEEPPAPAAREELGFETVLPVALRLLSYIHFPWRANIVEWLTPCSQFRAWKLVCIGRRTVLVHQEVLQRLRMKQICQLAKRDGRSRTRVLATSNE